MEMETLQKLFSRANAMTMIKSPGILYYCIQPSQEEVKLKPLHEAKKVKLSSVINFKSQVVGYVFEYSEKGAQVIINDKFTSAAISYGKKTTYNGVTVFNDSKVRLLSFDDLDYALSIKWKGQSEGKN